MNEILFKGEAEDTAGPAEEGASEGAALALSADDFSALENRILRAVELVKRERQARVAAEERATVAEGLLAEHAREQGAHADRLERDVKQLRAERDQVRGRVEKLLKQLDSLEL